MLATNIFLYIDNKICRNYFGEPTDCLCSLFNVGKLIVLSIVVSVLLFVNIPCQEQNGYFCFSIEARKYLLNVFVTMDR